MNWAWLCCFYFEVLLTLTPPPRVRSRARAWSLWSCHGQGRRPAVQGAFRAGPGPTW